MSNLTNREHAENLCEILFGDKDAQHWAKNNIIRYLDANFLEQQKPDKLSEIHSAILSVRQIALQIRDNQNKGK